MKKVWPVFYTPSSSWSKLAWTGLLVWARNGERVNTSRQYENLPEGKGIAPKKKNESQFPEHGNVLDVLSRSKSPKSKTARMANALNLKRRASSSESSSDYSSGGEYGPGEKEHNVGHYDSHKEGEGKVGRATYWVSPRAVMDMLLRKTLRGNM
ncbi:hypothetical protein BT69DRAFT_727271 [Atractiella rhizophila]|nr:hypothetical protein BT69DRAFT_727271 [Atractiella rhizophila]